MDGTPIPEGFSLETGVPIPQGFQLEDQVDQKQAPDGFRLRGPSDNGFGLRADGTKKGSGWLGPLQRPDGRISSEISIGVDIATYSTIA